MTKIIVKPVVNGTTIQVEDIKGVLHNPKFFSYNSELFIEVAQENVPHPYHSIGGGRENEYYLIRSRSGKATHSPAHVTEFHLFDSDGNEYNPTNVSELAEYSEKVKGLTPNISADAPIDTGSLATNAKLDEVKSTIVTEGDETQQKLRDIRDDLQEITPYNQETVPVSFTVTNNVMTKADIITAEAPATFDKVGLIQIIPQFEEDINTNYILEFEGDTSSTIEDEESTTWSGSTPRGFEDSRNFTLTVNGVCQVEVTFFKNI